MPKSYTAKKRRTKPIPNLRFSLWKFDEHRSEYHGKMGQSPMRRHLQGRSLCEATLNRVYRFAGPYQTALTGKRDSLVPERTRKFPTHQCLY